MKRLKWILPILAIIPITLVGLYVYTLIYWNTPAKPSVQSVQVTKDVPLNADTILTLVNAERAKAGVAPLTLDPRLVQSSQTKADDMVTNNYFAHINPATGVNGYTLIPSGMCVYRSENIGNSIDLSGDNNQQTVEWWMNSKPHHDAMLNPEYTLTGIAVNGHYSVQHFCQQ